MQTALYILWILVPLTYFLLALWSRLEQATHIQKGKKRSKEASDLLSQAYFVTGCSIATYFVDRYFAQEIEPFLPSFIPLGFVQIMILPLMLLIGGYIVGGSKPIRIEKAPRPTEQRENGSSRRKPSKRRK
ncbi:MAG: hypothetical protein KDD55_08735 [Bdellovibrionales bacterium]|nr:hypothetical protein [Bdellovibrionales bacterium]